MLKKNINLMITKEEKKTIQGILKKYHAKRVLLFGSSVSDNGNDINLNTNK